MATLLLVDDEPKLIFKQVSHVFAPRGFKIELVRSGSEAISQIARHQTDVVLLDVVLPDMGGLEVYQRIRQIDARIPVIFVTQTTSTDTAIEAMRRGAFEYLFKPLDLDRLDEVVMEALEVVRLMREPTVVTETASPAVEDVRGDAIVGRCPAMGEVYKAIGRVADQNVIVLINGESGTGKELVARAIYQHSGRSDKPFLAINCAAIPESLLASELFGHEKGAFTGADRRKIGKFEQANGGTIFLDEVGDIPLDVQVKLLRVLQEREVDRVGGLDPVPVDVRVVAATNRDIRAMVTAGRFREDLFYRLQGIVVQVPPLRERRQEIPALVEQFRSEVMASGQSRVRGFTTDAMDELFRREWPGNIRELRMAVHRAMGLATGELVERRGVAAALPVAPAPPVPPRAAA